LRKKKKTTRRVFLTALGTAAATSLATVGGYHYSAHIETEWLKVERVTVPLCDPDSALEGLVLVQMSDFHLYPFTKIEFIREAVSTANSLSPDLILLTGDYVLAEAEAIFELAPALARLDAKYGVFAILGNHDLWTSAEVVQRGLEEGGFPVLLNAGVTLSIGRSALYIAGLEDGWSGHPHLNKALEGCPQGATTILLMHEPDWADTLFADDRVSLQLSGHSHGGQVRLPGIGAPVLPRFAHKYDQGLYRVHDMWLYVNRGIGVIDPPIRFRCRPEITEITLGPRVKQAS